MIYQQTFYYYLFSSCFTLLIFLRLHVFFKGFFDKEMAWLVPLTILIHPLSIDLFLGPNLVSGALAFWLFIEAQLLIQKKEYSFGFLLLVFASLCNISFSFVTIYFLWQQREIFKRFRLPVFIFLVYLSLFLYQNLLVEFHNPFTFIVYYLQALILPLFMTLFNYSLFSFPLISLVVVLIILGIFVFRQRKDDRSKPFWIFLLVPFFAVLFHPWNEDYKYWHEIIFKPSSYLCVTFSFVTIMAIHTPKRIFYAYFLFLLIISVNWGQMWFPISGLLEATIMDLPVTFKQEPVAKRVLAWQYIYEGNIKPGRYILKELSNSDPKNEDLKKDLYFIKNQ